MADLKAIRLAAADATAQRERLAQQVAGIQADLASARTRLAAARAAGDGAAEREAAVAIERLVAARKAPARGVADLHDRLAGRLGQLLGSDSALEGDVPLVRLPVRVEVRSTAGEASLRVRIFHDAVHTESLDEGLGDDERAAGTAYWTAVWASGDTQAPWPALIAATGKRRAPWVAAALTP